jgi:ribosomal protein L6P/L9E
MSRIGRLPVAIPAGVTVDIQENNHVVVKGPKGTLERTLPSEMTIKLEDGHVVVTRPNDLTAIRSLFPVSAKRKLASMPLKSETREDLSHTRARESSMLMK